MMRIVVVTILFVGTFVQIWGQSSDWQNQVQSIIDSDPRMASYNTLVQDVSSIKFSYPIVEEINLRTETDQNNFARQEYAIRTMFNGIGLSRTFRKQKEVYLQQKQWDKQRYEQDIIFESFKPIVDVHFYEVKDTLLSQLISYNRRRIQLLINQVQQGEIINPKDILRIEQDIYEYTVEKGQLSVKAKSASLQTKLPPIKVVKLYTAQELLSLVTKLDLEQSLAIDIAEGNLGMQEASIDDELRHKNGRRILDYAQLRYSRRDNLLFEDEFSLGLGLRIPYQGSLKRSSALAKIDIAESAYKASLARVERTLESQSLKVQLLSIIEEISYYESNTDKVFKTLNVSHPETAIEIQHFRDELSTLNKIKITELHHKAYMIYLELLHKRHLLSTDCSMIWKAN